MMLMVHSSCGNSAGATISLATAVEYRLQNKGEVAWEVFLRSALRPSVGGDPMGNSEQNLAGHVALGETRVGLSIFGEASRQGDFEWTLSKPLSPHFLE
jgi:hypothetical protein